MDEDRARRCQARCWVEVSLPPALSRGSGSIPPLRSFLTFWRMVLHALETIALVCLLFQSVHHPCNQGYQVTPNPQKLSNLGFSYAPPHLRPPTSFVLDQIRACYDDFLSRDRRECEGEVLEVVSKIYSIINAQPTSLTKVVKQTCWPLQRGTFMMANCI